MTAFVGAQTAGWTDFALSGAGRFPYDYRATLHGNILVAWKFGYFVHWHRFERLLMLHWTRYSASEYQNRTRSRDWKDFEVSLLIKGNVVGWPEVLPVDLLGALLDRGFHCSRTSSQERARLVV